MTIESFDKTYLITDSELISVQVEYNVSGFTQLDRVTIRLKCRKVVSKIKWELVAFTLVFAEPVKFSFHDSFDCRIISQSTLVQTDAGYYLALDPFEEGRPSEKDNMVIESRVLYFIDEQGQEHKFG